jgi:hypothetical protein
MIRTLVSVAPCCGCSAITAEQDVWVSAVDRLAEHDAEGGDDFLQPGVVSSTFSADGRATRWAIRESTFATAPGEVLHLVYRCHTSLMPTTKIRHTITETEEVARALDEAAKRWPEERAARSRLLLRLVVEGYRALREERDERAARRRAAVQRTSGSLTGVYSDDYLDRLRGEWPE